MPSRILREGILSSERVDALNGWASECFYRRLMSVVDDYGRYFANPSLLRAACYPLKLDKVSNADIGKWLADCAGADLVSTYEIEGKAYLQVLDFRQQERAKQSKFPEPPSKCSADAKQVITDVHLDEVVFVVEDGAGKPPARASKSKEKTTIPLDFSITERVRQWASAKGHGPLLELHFEAFVSTCKAKDYRYADWDEAFMNAIRKNWAELKPGDGMVRGLAI